MTQELFGLLKVLMPFLSSLNNLKQDVTIIFHKGVDNFEIEQKNPDFWLGMQCPLKQSWHHLVCFI